MNAKEQHNTTQSLLQYPYPLWLKPPWESVAKGLALLGTLHVGSGPWDSLEAQVWLGAVFCFVAGASEHCAVPCERPLARRIQSLALDFAHALHIALAKKKLEFNVRGFSAGSCWKYVLLLQELSYSKFLLVL